MGTLLGDFPCIISFNLHSLFARHCSLHFAGEQIKAEGLGNFPQAIMQ